MQETNIVINILFYLYFYFYGLIVILWQWFYPISKGNPWLIIMTQKEISTKKKLYQMINVLMNMKSSKDLDIDG